MANAFGFEPSAMKVVVLTTSGEPLATPTPAELVKLFVDTPKVGINFAKIFQEGEGDSEEKSVGVDDDSGDENSGAEDTDVAGLLSSPCIQKTPEAIPFPQAPTPPPTVTSSQQQQQQPSHPSRLRRPSCIVS
jgi:NIMA (never in mitosis gene a)-related kinase